jgi:ornithine carbamoyltransferase
MIGACLSEAARRLRDMPVNSFAADERYYVMSISMSEKQHGHNSGGYQMAQSRYEQRIQTRPRSLISLADLDADELKGLIRAGLHAKANPSEWQLRLSGNSIALLFEKPSTRTRCSFEVGAAQMGGYASFIDWRTSNFTNSDLRDEIKVLSRYYDLIVGRVNHHETIRIMADESEVPVINGLCDRFHPCQALSDYMTLLEYFGKLDGLVIAYLGDANNVCRSLAQGAANLGVRLRVCSPPEYAPDQEMLVTARGQLDIVQDPADAVRNANVIYTDTWVSMGRENETAARHRALSAFQVNSALIKKAPSDVLVMHCLPAHRDQEITAEVLLSRRSIVFDQAENRTYAQKALMSWILSDKAHARV